MPKKRIIVLGAGLSGLSAAWHLKRSGVACCVFEKEPEPGGLCRSRQRGDFNFDYSGHLLHFKTNYGSRLVKSLLGSNLIEHKRKAWVDGMIQIPRLQEVIKSKKINHRSSLGYSAHFCYLEKSGPQI